MFDLPYILTHPLLQRIIRRCKELEEQARPLTEGSQERKAIEKRIGELQEYGLPRPTAKEEMQTEIIREGDWRDRMLGRQPTGRVVGVRRSLRHRYVEVRRGRPTRWRVQVRAALEEQLANPCLSYGELARKVGMTRSDLERQIGFLRKLLKRERIKLPAAADYRAAEDEFTRKLAALDARQSFPPL